jgi:hypothetical protein
MRGPKHLVCLVSGRFHVLSGGGLIISVVFLPCQSGLYSRDESPNPPLLGMYAMGDAGAEHVSCEGAGPTVVSTRDGLLVCGSDLCGLFPFFLSFAARSTFCGCFLKCFHPLFFPLHKHIHYGFLDLELFVHCDVCDVRGVDDLCCVRSCVCATGRA